MVGGELTITNVPERKFEGLFGGSETGVVEGFYAGFVLNLQRNFSATWRHISRDYIFMNFIFQRDDN